MNDTENVVVLFKGGRLPSWHALSRSDQKAYEDEHVELMLGVAERSGLKRLEGFRLVTPEADWQRFWTIDFPAIEGAEAWIAAEMAPPYGDYGYYEYSIARSWSPDFCADWVTAPQASTENQPSGRNPREIPKLNVDLDSIVVVLFERGGPGHVAGEKRVTPDYIERMRTVAEEHRLMRLEAFKLTAPQHTWHQAWLAEFPTLSGAEAWINAEVDPTHGCHMERSFHLTRKWSPEYFAQWIPRT